MRGQDFETNERGERVVRIPYEPREWTRDYHNRKQRFACLVIHRRAGKTVAVVNDLIRAALTCPLPNPRTAYVAPLYTQAKDVAWNYAKEYTATIPGIKINESELRIELPNGGQFRLYGADNYDRMRGLYFDAVGLDEPADYPADAWPLVIRPALADRQGRATFMGTPKGRNQFYDIYQEALTKPDEWFTQKLKASESGILLPSELEAARRDMEPNQYDQEFECSFDAAIRGAYYGEEIRDAFEEDRVTHVPYDRSAPVTTAWDLGVDDSTAIWFLQAIGREMRVIDYLEDHDHDAGYYVQLLKGKKYRYHEHLLPHDAGAREIGSGLTYKQQLERHQLSGRVRVLPRTKDLLGDINATRNFISRCYFDAQKCARGIEALKQYQREWDDKKRTFKAKPRHDWTSHGADAFRAAAVAMKPQRRDGGAALNYNRMSIA